MPLVERGKAPSPLGPAVDAQLRTLPPFKACLVRQQTSSDWKQQVLDLSPSAHSPSCLTGRRFGCGAPARGRMRLRGLRPRWERACAPARPARHPAAAAGPHMGVRPASSPRPPPHTLGMRHPRCARPLAAPRQCRPDRSCTPQLPRVRQMNSSTCLAQKAACAQQGTPVHAFGSGDRVTQHAAADVARQARRHRHCRAAHPIRVAAGACTSRCRSRSRCLLRLGRHARQARSFGFLGCGAAQAGVAGSGCHAFAKLCHIPAYAPSWFGEWPCRGSASMCACARPRIGMPLLVTILHTAKR